MKAVLCRGSSEVVAWLLGHDGIERQGTGDVVGSGQGRDGEEQREK